MPKLDKNSSLLKWATFYADEWGASVIPLREGKQPAVRWSEFQQRRPDEAELASWFEGDKPAWGMALVCGSVSGNLVRLDFDDPKDFERLITRPDIAVDLDLIVQLRHAPMFKSQRKGGGYGVVFRNEWTIRKVPGGKFKNYPKLELMGEGSITIVPPTPGYAWTDDIMTLPTISLPDRFLGHDLRGTARETPERDPPDDELESLLGDTEEGGRDDALVRIVNILRSRGLRLGAIKKTIQPHFDEWPGAGDTMTWEQAEATIQRAYERYAHEGTRFSKDATSSGLRLPGSTLELEKFERTAFDPAVGRSRPKAEDHLVDRLVMGGDQANVAMAAFTGTGKTTIGLVIAVCMTQARPVWGVLDVPRPLKVIFIDQEEVLDQIEETLSKLAEPYGTPPVGQMLVLSGKGRPYSVTDPETMDSLYADIERFRPDFIFLDGWQWFVGGRVNDKEIVNPALGWLRSVRSKFGCGTWIIHHTKKIGSPKDRPLDSLELASGAQELMNQARTKLIYEHMKGYPDYGYLHGRTGRSTWNPVKIVLEYDQSTQSHRMIGREEADNLFDQDAVAEYYGELTKTRVIKGLLNRLKRADMTDMAVADFLGVTRGAVSKWRSGATIPPAERVKALEKLANEVAPVNPGKRARNARETLAPIKRENMPQKGDTYMYNNNKTHVDVPNVKGEDEKAIATQTPKAKTKKAPSPKGFEGKPGSLCGRCPLREQPYVGGRGGSPGCVMLVGDGPGQTDAKSGKAYSGRTGLRLEKGLRAAKIDPNLCRYVNAVACHVLKSKAPTKKALECCRPLLEKELAEYSPKTVITLGDIALKAFYPGKLRDYHGLRIDGDGYTLVPMYKPDAGDKSPELMRAFVDDFYGLKDRPKMRKLEGDYKRAEIYIPSSTTVAVDTETTGLALTSEIVGVGLCDTPGEAVYMSKEAGIISLREHPPERAIMQNAKYDLGIFESNGLPISTFKDVEDTMLLAYVMNLKPLGLKGLSLQQLNLEMRFFKDVLGNKATFAEVEEAEATQYGCADPDATLRLWNHMWRRADARERRLYRLVEKPLPPILAQMQLNGVLIDVPYLEKLGGTMEAELRDLMLLIKTQYDVSEETLNSPQKLAHYLYRELNLPVPYKTDSGAPSTEHDALERLKGKHPFIDVLLKYRRLSKLKSTFVDGLLARQVHGLVFPEFNQVGTTTGRPSSSDPNMQNLPKRTDKTIRKAFIAPEGYSVVSLDNSQVDLRVLAYVSKDPELMRIFEEDLDVHSETAMAIYNMVDAAMRRTAKTANFLVVFGGGAAALAVKAGIPFADAEKFLNEWWERHPGVKSWVNSTHKFALANGYAETWMGRRRYVPKLFTGQRAKALREIQNAPVQGGSSDVLKMQISAVADVSIPFSQVHDELNFYVRTDVLNDTVRELRRRMEGIECPFKLRVEAGVGPSLGELTEWEVRT